MFFKINVMVFKVKSLSEAHELYGMLKKHCHIVGNSTKVINQYGSVEFSNRHSFSPFKLVFPLSLEFQLNFKKL